MKIETTMTHLRMLASVRGELWMMGSDRIQEFALAALEATERVAGEFTMEDFYDMREGVRMDGNGIAHIQVKGSLLNKCPRIYEKLGLATCYQTIVDETETAVAEGAVGILYHVDSPGGTVAGVVEAGDAIRNAGAPTGSHCSGLSCSAAYWLTSQTGHVNATPSAQVGNVGAILSWADCSAFWEDLGIEFKALVSDGADLKSTFHLEPDETQLEFLQESIDEAGAAFRAAVESGRGQVDAEVWRAGWYSGDAALKLGLVDSVGRESSVYDEILEESVNLSLSNQPKRK